MYWTPGHGWKGLMNLGLLGDAFESFLRNDPVFSKVYLGIVGSSEILHERARYFRKNPH